MNRYFSSFFSMLVVFVLFSCSPKVVIIDSKVRQNSRQSMQQDYLILVSCDGFRWDYVERFQPPNLKKFISEGVQAESMLSCYPSKTFPNHYSIATGMYPDRHGLVDNSYFDPEKNEVYRIGDRQKVEDGSWYKGTPIWVQAARSGMVTASFFFVGSEADVQGVRPTYYYHYDGSIPNDKRVEQVLDWLKLPEKERPHLITLYFSDMDDKGHRFSPDADAILENTLLKLDKSLGKLFEGVKQSKLPVNIIIVSDHGMVSVPLSQLLLIEQLEDKARYRVVNGGALVHFYLKDGVEAEAVYEELKAKEDHFKIYRTKEVPYFEIPPESPRWGDLMAIPDPGWYFVSQRVATLRKAEGQDPLGEHGYDPEIRDLHGIFYAGGPAFKEGLTIGAFKNLHVYPLMCRLLGLKVPAEVDGKIEVLEEVLR